MSSTGGQGAVVEGFSGAAGGIIALLATYPLLTVSTVQATRRDPRQQAGGKASIPNTLQELQEVIKEHGWRGLWAGVEASLLGTAVSQGVYFYFYSLIRQAFVRRHQAISQTLSTDIGVGPSLIVASLAGCINVLLTCPIWVVSTRAQAQSSERQAGVRAKGPLEIGKDIFEEQGILGFWKGVLPSLVMVSNPAVNYMFYEGLVARYHRHLGGLTTRRLGVGEVFLLSALAKLGATVVTYPILLVKARLQAAGRHTASERSYRGTLDAIFRIWRSEGPLGFYKGLRPKVVQSILAAALLMAIKEELAATTSRLLLATAITHATHKATST